MNARSRKAVETVAAALQARLPGVVILPFGLDLSEGAQFGFSAEFGDRGVTCFFRPGPSDFLGVRGEGDAFRFVRRGRGWRERMVDAACELLGVGKAPAPEVHKEVVR